MRKLVLRKFNPPLSKNNQFWFHIIREDIDTEPITFNIERSLYENRAFSFSRTWIHFLKFLWRTTFIWVLLIQFIAASVRKIVYVNLFSNLSFWLEWRLCPEPKARVAILTSSNKNLLRGTLSTITYHVKSLDVDVWMWKCLVPHATTLTGQRH